MCKSLRIAFVVMYSEEFAMAGETHGVSVLAGVVKKAFQLMDKDILILDMYGLSQKEKVAYIKENIKRFKPDIIAFSCPYGSYSALKKEYLEISKNFLKHACVIFGGALPTYIPEKFIELDRSAYVVRGEGEEAIVKIIELYLQKKNVSKKDIPNICYYHNGSVQYNNRKLVDLCNVEKPYREHLGTTLKKDAQIYVEHSRGCSWGHCSFCSRNLLSLENCKVKYRIFKNERLLQDLQTLWAKGIRFVTFSDEDFCGSGLTEMRDIVEIFKKINNTKEQIKFDVSMNVNAIYSDKRSFDTQREYENLLLELKKYGLRKVFLGVESGSDTQLKRYRKQQSVHEAAQAIRILEKSNIEVEIGYIIFDPLCTMEEIRENLMFLYINDFAKYVSSLGSGLDLRLQMDTPYVKMLLQYENQNGICLHSEQYDLDTLNYLSYYLNKDVERMVQYVRKINSIIRPLYYPLKSLSRYGESGSLQGNVNFIKDMVVDIRQNYLKSLIELSENITDVIISEKIVDSIKKYIQNLFLCRKNQLLDIATKTNNEILWNCVMEYSLVIEE